eukprot:7929069-Pyramimonas_sp.AAC.1
MTYIDRVFTSLPAHFIRENKIVVNIRYDAQELSLWKLSDHAMVELKLEPRTEAPKAEQAIPKFLFETTAFQKQIEILLAACELDSMTASEQWGCAKRQM